MKPGNPLAKVVPTAVFIILFSVTSPEDAFADGDWRTLGGSWFVEVSPLNATFPDGTVVPAPPPFANLATVNWDRTIITSDPIAGGGHGAWKRTGRQDFEIRFLVVVPPVLHPDTLPPFLANTILTVTAFLTVDSRDTASGEVFATYSDFDGNPVFNVDGTVNFSRINVD